MQFTPLHKPRRHRFTKPPAGARIRLDHPWAQGLVLALLFNENGGRQLNDLVGGKRILHVNQHANRCWESGPFGPCLHKFNNSEEFLQSELDAGDFSYLFSKGCTVLLRCKPGTNGWNAVFQLNDISNFGPEICYQVNAADNRVQLFSGTGWYEATDGRIVLNTWLDLAATTDYTAAGTGTWTNRIKQITISQNDPPNRANTLGELTLGILYWGGVHTPAEVTYDYVYLFNRRLPDDLIVAIAREPFAFLR